MRFHSLYVDAGAQLVLLGALLVSAAQALAPIAPLGWRGVGIALVLYGTIAGFIWRGLPGHAPHERFGAANGVTVARAAFVALLLALVGEALWGEVRLDAPLRWTVVSCAMAALLLDGVDGWLARRSGLASDFGARFDMETDSLFLLALSLLVLACGQAGGWVLTIGLLRYIFILGGWRVPALAAKLPESRRRKAVCVAATMALIAALVPAVPAAAGGSICLAGLLLLGYSFGADVVWLAGRRVQPSEETGGTKPC